MPTSPEPTSTPTNQFALWSMISGIVSLTVGWFIPFPTGIVAVVLGHIGLHQIKKSGEAGRHYAITGLITGYVAIGIGLIAAAFLVIFFGALVFGSLGGYGHYYAPDLMHP